MKYLTFALALILGSCSQEKADLKVEEEKILQCWTDWPAKAKAGNPEFYFADDAVITGQNIPSARGKDQITKFYASMPKVPGLILKWNEMPNIIHFSNSGDMAYSIDTLKISAPDSTGIMRTEVHEGIHVWKKDSTGNWRVALLTFYSKK